MPEPLFIDTSALIALTIRDDVHSNQAIQFWSEFAEKPIRVTTNLVVSEAYTLIRRWTKYGVAIQFLDALRDSQMAGTLRQLWPTADWQDEIRRVITTYSDQDLSYVDAVSLVACRRTPMISTVFSFNRRLGLTGLTVVPGPTRQTRSNNTSSSALA